MNATPIYAGIEGGGTKYVCALSYGRSPELISRASFPTLNDPNATLGACIAWLKEQQAAHGKISAIGVGSFGPIELNKASPEYGRVTTTPKPGWEDADVAGAFARAFGVPVGFDTDVNGAALGELEWGAGRGLNSLVYITIGTGIGGGAVINGQPLHGLLHPEMGHLRLSRNPSQDTFAGNCPAHGDCWEGLCSGPAINKRLGVPAETLPADHPVWPQVAHYTGIALTNIILTLSPERIILGGSVPKAGQMGQQKFMALVRAETAKTLNGYLKVPALLQHIDDYIVPPGLGDNAGVCGAVVLAKRAAGE